MLKHMIADIKAFFANTKVNLQNDFDREIRLLRLINRSYAQLASEYPLPECNQITTIKIDTDNIYDSDYFSDYIPFRSQDNRKFTTINPKILAEFSITDIFGLQATAIDSTVNVNNTPIRLMQRKSFAVEHSPYRMDTIVRSHILPFSTYIFKNLQNLSTWHLEIWINGRLEKTFSSVNNRSESFTNLAWGTIKIDWRTEQIDIRSGNMSYELIIKTAYFTSYISSAVIDNLGIRFTRALKLSNNATIVFSQTIKPPMLLEEKDTTINPEYDNAVVLYAIENLATYARDIFNSQIAQAIAMKKEEQISRLVRMVSNYRTTQYPIGNSIPTIGGACGIRF